MDLAKLIERVLTLPECTEEHAAILRRYTAGERAKKLADDACDAFVQLVRMEAITRGARALSHTFAALLNDIRGDASSRDSAAGFAALALAEIDEVPTVRTDVPVELPPAPLMVEITYRDLTGELRDARVARGSDFVLLDDGTALMLGWTAGARPDVARLSRSEAERIAIERGDRVPMAPFVYLVHGAGLPVHHHDDLPAAVRHAQAYRAAVRPRRPCLVVEQRSGRQTYICWVDGEWTRAGHAIMADLPSKTGGG